ncbi:MAG: 1-acyl-sn-glycerol-3-phosphate acyltransferase [Spartobacteria bacterium]|nr:1-acyl-sn-glycerol-3-phosphate acyltransferase [Spartobacteria bacterium]
MARKINKLYQLCRRAIKCWALLWFRLRAYGMEQIPEDGGCIIAANHASFLDPPLLGAAVYRRGIHFMARDTLFKKGIGKWLLTEVGCVPLDRTKGDVAALRRGLTVLKDGHVLGLFPEGTRTDDGELHEPKGGIAFLVAKSHVPVVPVYIDGTYRALSRHHTFVKPAKVRLFFGTPITPAEIEALGKGREAYEKVGALVMERIAALKPA